MRNLLLLVLTVFASFFSYSQEERLQKFSFGFYLELNRTFLDERIDDFAGEILTSVSSVGSGLGISMDYSVTPKFSLSTVAGLTFSEASIDFIVFDQVVNSFKVYPQNLDFRLHGTYAFGNKVSHPYLLFGPSIMTPLTGNREKEETTEFINRTGISLDLGVGFDKELEIFRFSPEIRYSYGLNDINNFPLIESLHVHRLTLTLHFKD